MESTADMMTIVRELKDRQDILDCIYRYARGIDRGDRDLVMSAYHAHAIDDHGLVVGMAGELVDWALDFHREHQTQLAIMNHSCELSGDTAHTETYFLYTSINKVGPTSLGGGRYVDRFERRDGRWGIAARVCVSEWSAELGRDPRPADIIAVMTANAASSRSKNDISYMRPLQVTRPLTRK